MAEYLHRIWGSRYFWTHLALSDVRTKFRRSRLGILWAILNPLLFTLLLAFVMGSFFGQPMDTYAPYVFSGIIVWQLIVNSANNGCMAFIHSDQYIKQFVHPMSIYPLRFVLVNVIMFALGMIGLLFWVAVALPQNMNWSFLSLFVAVPIYIAVAWPIAIITAFLNTQFRDFEQMVTLIFQAVWYASPVFIADSLFREAGLGYLVEINPVYHLLELVRKPLLSGEFPSVINYGYSLVAVTLLWAIAIWLIWRKEREMIFFL